MHSRRDSGTRYILVCFYFFWGGEGGKWLERGCLKVTSMVIPSYWLDSVEICLSFKIFTKFHKSLKCLHELGSGTFSTFLKSFVE